MDRLASEAASDAASSSARAIDTRIERVHSAFASLPADWPPTPPPLDSDSCPSNASSLDCIKGRRNYGNSRNRDVSDHGTKPRIRVYKR